jgi:hypothetical protein
MEGIMQLAVGHNFPGRNRVTTITAFVGGGEALPMIAVAAIAKQVSGEISCANGNLTLTAAASYSAAHDAHARREQIECMLRSLVQKTARKRKKR